MENDTELVRVALCLARVRMVFDEVGLSHGEAIDCCAVLFAGELEEALVECGPAGGSAGFERFMQRVSLCCRSLRINLVEVRGGRAE
jgi:hypothetical protein